MPTLLMPQRATYHPLLQFIPKPVPYKLPLTPCCAVCGPEKTERNKAPPMLATCGRCKAVAYCGRDHQREDFVNHKNLCKYVEKRRKKMDELAAALPAEIFTERVGHFWHVHETRPYMEAKLYYMLALTVSRTFEGVSLALEQGLDCLRLCRTDNLGIRDVVPALMLMLGQHQACYDFLKWWATFDPTGTADLMDLSLPMFTVKNARMMEEIPEGFFSGRTSVFHWAALAFIKIEVAFEAVMAVDIKEETDRETPGLIDNLMSFLSSTPLTNSLIEKQTKRMKNAAADAICMAMELNKHYWPNVLDPHSLSGDIGPGFYQHGDRFEVQHWLVAHGLLWSQDPIRKDFISIFLNGMA